MKEYLNDNKMTMNPSKTILWEFMVRQKACKIKGAPPTLETEDDQGNPKVVRASKDERCLGGRLQNDLQWRSQIESGKDALLPALRRKLGILKFLARNIPKSSRKLLANGIIIGRINYLLPLYGGTLSKYQKKIQVVMNNTARFATGAGRRTSTFQLMEQMNWLTIIELTEYHTLILAWKLLHFGTPRHLAAKIEIHPDRTMSTTMPRLQNTELGLRWRLVHIWNSIPQDLREVQSLPSFKKKAKKWFITQRDNPSSPPNSPTSSPPPSPPAHPTSTPPSSPTTPHRGTPTRTQATLQGTGPVSQTTRPHQHKTNTHPIPQSLLPTQPTQPTSPPGPRMDNHPQEPPTNGPGPIPTPTPTLTTGPRPYLDLDHPPLEMD